MEIHVGVGFERGSIPQKNEKEATTKPKKNITTKAPNSVKKRG